MFLLTEKNIMRNNRKLNIQIYKSIFENNFLKQK